MLNKNHYKISSLFVICIIVIIIYGKFLCLTKINDPLKYRFFRDIDGWSITHFCFYTLIGYNFPDHILFAMTGGLLWEFFEFYYNHNKPTFLKHIGYCFENDSNNVWWIGKFSDLFMNLFGFLLGSYIGKKYNKEYIKSKLNSST